MDGLLHGIAIVGGAGGKGGGVHLYMNGEKTSEPMDNRSEASATA